MFSKFKINNPILSLIMVGFTYINFYYLFQILYSTKSIKDLIESSDKTAPFFSFLSLFDNPNILFSAIIFSVVSIVLVLLTFITSQHKNIISNLSVIILSFSSTLFFMYTIDSDTQVLESSIVVVEKVTLGDSIQSELPSTTKAFINNTKEYLKAYQANPTAENKAKYMTSFEIMAFNLDKVKTVNANNMFYFMKVIRLHVNSMVNYEYLIRSLTLFSFIILLSNWILLLQRLKTPTIKKDDA